jgi:hypothetical protein
MEIRYKASKEEDEDKKDHVKVNPWSLRITNPEI